MAQNRRQLIDELTEAVLIAHGYDDENDTEWDSENEDSQYSIVRDDVELVIFSLDQRGLLN